VSHLVRGFVAVQPRLLFSLLDATEAGGQRVALAIGEALAGRGWSLGVLAPAPGRAIDAFERLGARFHQADLHSLRNAADLPAAARALRSYDVLYSHTSIPGEILGGLAARVARRPHVVHRHTPVHLSPTSTIRPVQSVLYRIVMRDTPVIAVSQHVRSSVLRLGVGEDRVSVVSNGARGSIEPSPPRREGRLRIGLLGRIDPQKGMDVFLEAASMLNGYDVEFVIGGIGGAFPGYERRVRNRARELGVEILDTASQGLEFLSSLDIVVMPSRWEGSPITLFEAMALQKAIIASEIPGISEVLHPHKAGLLIPPEDPEATGQAIRRLVDDAQFRITLSSSARAASAGYAEERAVQEAVATLREALDDARPSQHPN